MIRKYGTAVWEGTLTEGRGRLSTESGILEDVPYSYKKRFDGQPGMNPEELIGTAHAACFSMALANILAGQGITATRIDAKSTISLSLEKGADIVGAHIVVTISAPADAAVLLAAAKEAETGCPVSKALAVEITMDATVV